MLSGITIGQYFPGRSLVHRMDPRVKLVLTFAYIVAVFIPRNWVGMGLAAGFLVFSVALSRLPLKLVWKSVKPILPLVLFTSVINIFFVDGGDILVDWWNIPHHGPGGGHGGIHRPADRLSDSGQQSPDLHHLAYHPDRRPGTADEAAQAAACACA